MPAITITELIDGLIQKEAGDFAKSLTDPGPFSVRQAARRVVTVIPPGDQEAVLRHLVTDLMYGTVFSCCLVDESLDESYAKCAELSKLLSDEVVRQGGIYPDHVQGAVEELIVRAIAERGYALHSNADAEHRAAAGQQPSSNPFI